MASKRRDKSTDTGVAGSITPTDDTPPVDVQPPEGTTDTPPAGDGEDAPEPVGTAEPEPETPSPVEDMPPVEAVTVDPAPVMDAPTGGLSTLEADTPPASAEDKPAKKGGRYDTPAKKAERNRKEKERREKVAAERAGKVARATGVAEKAAGKAASVKAAPAVVTVPAAAVVGVDMAVLLGLSFHALSMALPEKFGGGSLTAEERDLLGRAWSGPLTPYLSGAGGPWAMAAIATVQVFAMRAMMYQPPATTPAPVHSRPVDRSSVTTPEDARTAGDAIVGRIRAEPAPAPAPVKGVTMQEPGVGAD